MLTSLPTFKKIAPCYPFLPQGIVLARDSPGRKTRGKTAPDEITYLQSTNTEARVQHTLKSKCEFAIYRYQVRSIFGTVFSYTSSRDCLCVCAITLFTVPTRSKNNRFSRDRLPHPPLNKSCHYHCLLQKPASYLYARLTFKSTNTLVFFLLAPKCARGSRTKLLHTICTLNEIPPVKTTLSREPFKKR